jgi:hypothetical protein
MRYSSNMFPKPHEVHYTSCAACGVVMTLQESFEAIRAAAPLPCETEGERDACNEGFILGFRAGWIAAGGDPGAAEETFARMDCIADGEDPETEMD